MGISEINKSIPDRPYIAENCSRHIFWGLFLYPTSYLLPPLVAPMKSGRVQHAIGTILFLLAVAGQTAAIVARPSSPGDPYADPKNDPYNPLRYITSNVLTAIAFGAFPNTPCAFIAADYVLLGQLARHLGASNYLAIPARRITRVFVASDITTFLIQAAGGALSASANSTHLNFIGSRVFLAGLIVQLISFATFTGIYLVFLYRVRKNMYETWCQDHTKAWYNDWRALGCVLFLSCIGILIRSLYRVIELSQGYAGHLATTEAFFYGLDTLPLFTAVALYTPFWPGRFIANSETEHIEEKL
ncbi:hypothetical protein DXG01_000520 [Tephrocybe rancida]|nr:hypothetical protein DXG01_000520 [Tephrocybe rancida]